MSPEVEKLFKNEYPSSSRLRHPISDLSSKEISNKHDHLALFKKTVSHARLRSHLNEKEQCIFIPVDVNGEMDYGYENLRVNKPIVRFQQFTYVRSPNRPHYYFLKTTSNQNAAKSDEKFCNK